jgi:hypothetical protein
MAGVVDIRHLLANRHLHARHARTHPEKFDPKGVRCAIARVKCRAGGISQLLRCLVHVQARIPDRSAADEKNEVSEHTPTAVK